MSLTVDLRPCAGEAELSDPAFTGEFASEMATIAAVPQVAPWCGYVAWQGSTPLGFGGFKGAPAADGAVEIGYMTFPPHQGGGVAKSIAAAMTRIARANGAKSVLAHTLCEENASTGVLHATGFNRDGFGHDDDVGQVWRWQLGL